jgi:hypothetical protein
VRDALVAALAACANSRPSRWRTRRFLTGLSSDELQFIAECLGSGILRSSGYCLHPPSTRPRSRDQEHKMILLVEFLGRSGLQQTALQTRTAHWN